LRRTTALAASDIETVFIAYLLLDLYPDAGRVTERGLVFPLGAFVSNLLMSSRCLFEPRLVIVTGRWCATRMIVTINGDLAIDAAPAASI
jgi:hypothetical protein